MAVMFTSAAASLVVISASCPGLSFMLTLRSCVFTALAIPHLRVISFIVKHSADKSRNATEYRGSSLLCYSGIQERDRKEVGMPAYEYLCNDCKKEFTVF